jgi:hypothetical protein
LETRGQAAVAHTAAQVEAGTLRHQVLVTAQKFKSSWVELGGLLVKVREAGSWEGWGFKSFEDYCTRELRIKKQTALKLTSSYGFLARHERGLVDRPSLAVVSDPQPRQERPTPAFEVISVLAGAEERGQLGEEDYRELRETIWTDDRPAAQLARELSQRFPAPAKPPPPADLALRRFAVAARKLATDLRASGQVPKAVAERAEALAEDVEELAQNG